MQIHIGTCLVLRDYQHKTRTWNLKAKIWFRVLIGVRTGFRVLVKV